MKINTQQECDALITRFYGLADGVLRQILIRYLDCGTRDCELRIACRDSQTIENEGWVEVRVNVRNTEELAIRESVRTTLQVMSEGIHICVLEDRVAIEFGGALEPPLSLGDFRMSDAYIIGFDAAVEVHPY